MQYSKCFLVILADAGISCYGNKGEQRLVAL